MVMYDVTNSYFEMTDRLVQEGLDQRGSKLMPFVIPQEVIGESVSIVQSFVGEAQDIEGHNELTKFTPVTFDKRVLTPRAFQLPISLSKIDAIKQGGIVDPGILANQCLNKIGKKIDSIIIDGIGGGSYSAGAKKYLPLPGAKEVTSKIGNSNPSKEKIVEYYDSTQTIAWNDCTLSSPLNKTPLATKVGLNVAKVTKGVQKIREKYADESPLVLACNPWQMSTLMADELCANLMYNTQPSMSTGIANPIAGISNIVVTNLVERNQKAASKSDGTKANGDGVNVEYAYIFAQQHIRLGCSLPIEMDNLKDPNRGASSSIIYTGMYGCVRMFEEAVVRIEIARGISDETGLVY